ncbi:MAG TPA: tetratricopeptide repeat protein [Nitrospirales bacterium]
MLGRDLPAVSRNLWLTVTLQAAVALIMWIAAIAASSPLPAPTMQELMEHGDRLRHDEEKFPQSLEEALSLYRQASAMQPGAAAPYIRIAEICLALGDDVKEKDKSLAWYRQGEHAAEEAIQHQEKSADAHFLLAANRGKVVNLLPFWKVSPTILADLEKHLQRALALEPSHARANHMMGMVLYRTPGPLRLMLTGKREQVEGYLLRSVESDPSYADARLDLAQFYKETGRPAQARTHAEAILAMHDSSSSRAWIEKYRPAAEQLLKSLPTP